MKTVSVYWARRDFRLLDNPALSMAVAEAKKPGNLVCPVFVLEDYMCKGDPQFQFGYPQRLFLAKALPSFAKQFTSFYIVRGKAAKSLRDLSEHFSAMGYEVKLFVNDDVHPDFYSQVARLRQAGVSVEVFPDQMTVDPATVTGAGNQYSVFTPFKSAVWKSFLTATVLPKTEMPGLSYVDVSSLPPDIKIVAAETQTILKQFSEARTFVVKGSRSHIFDVEELTSVAVSIAGWYTTEEEALDRFHTYCREGMAYYADRRDSLSADTRNQGTSRMSLALTWGLVSARYLKSVIQKEFEFDFTQVAPKSVPLHVSAPAMYLSELLWREFYKYLLFHDPLLLGREFQERYRGTIAWVEEKEAFRRFTAWIKGETGYPIVDAAMRQIAAEGWMHNRSRMIVASVLTKNLGVDWRWGQEYFRAQLFDLDEASNNGGWQWGASVGADPKPIRIFNPYLQAANYDRNGEYQRKWIRDSDDAKARTPIVAHAQARTEALTRYGLRYSRLGLSRGSRTDSMF